MKKEEKVYFVSGIDTDAGKSYATGFLARCWREQGLRTITQKFIQTGNAGRSEDIELHRRIMGCGLLPEDRERLTMPEIFTFPASPLLASKIDGRAVDFGKIERATATLAGRYDRVLLEGAGGLMVPLTEELLTIDYIARRQYPLIFITSGRLGSINHTLLSLEAVKRRGIRLDRVLYNSYPEETNPLLRDDTFHYLQGYLKREFPDTALETFPVLDVWA